MKNPKVKTKVVHSRTRSAWNVIGVTLGNKHKIAVLPYIENIELEKEEAFQHAEFISHCFNHSDFICKKYFSNIH